MEQIMKVKVIGTQGHYFTMWYRIYLYDKLRFGFFIFSVSHRMYKWRQIELEEEGYKKDIFNFQNFHSVGLLDEDDIQRMHRMFAIDLGEF